jgi:glycosyltransferase involved in cell wall biosynthesis
MQPKVSVVMGSYNHAAFVREAVESVLSQSFADLELVITDDGSPDGTADVIRAIKDPRIDFLAFPENHGTCDALNHSIGRSRGQYLAVLSSDDFFLPGRLARQVEFLDTHPEVGAVFGLPRVVDENSQELPAGTHPFTTIFTGANRDRIGWLRHFFEIGNCLCHPTILIRRTCYDKVGLYDRVLLNLPDLDMWIRLCTSYDIHVLSEQLTAFRVLKNERNTSAPSPANLARTAWELPQVLRHYLELPASELQAIVSLWQENRPGLSPLAVLALAALRIDRPGHRPFAIQVLRDLIVRDPEAFSVKEYFQLVGQKNPFSASGPAIPPSHLKGFSMLHGLLDRAEDWCRQRLMDRKP